MQFFPACSKEYAPNTNPNTDPDSFSGLDMIISYADYRTGDIIFEFHCERRDEWITANESWETAKEAARNLFYDRSWTHLESSMLWDVDVELERRKTNPLLVRLLNATTIRK